MESPEVLSSFMLILFKSNKMKSKNKKNVKTQKTGGKAPLTKFDPLQRYLAEISQYELLTKEEEYQLAVGCLQTGYQQLKVSGKDCPGIPSCMGNESAGFNPRRQYRINAGREEI